ncbi:hypothetical protein BJ508DRAFT_365942 [Ascobolus immersus RN42]|uniref:DNA damage-binding protein 1 n=1 Tax=Ascobolus immersus RN42 TaxID=1160509 RepID=A0A3N4HSA0_ASCIM|nr:hypothetical protein BJ508DRAFT_365942 [Ascobolus immersus RN42]
MAYVATLHKPGKVYDAIVTDFLEPDVPNLILIKLDYIEIYSLPAPTRLLHSFQTHTSLLSGIAHKPASSATSHLFLATPNYSYFSISWDPTTNSIATAESFLDTSERFARASENPKLIVDPQKRCIASHNAQGVLHIFNISRNKEGFRAVSEKALGRIEAPERVRFGEFGTGDIVFLEATESEDAKEGVVVVVGVVDPVSNYWGTKAYRWGFKKTKSNIPPLEEVEEWGIPTGGDIKVEGGADDLVLILPVSGKYGGYVAVGPSMALYKPDPRSNEDVIVKEMSRLDRGIEAWCKLDDERFLVGDMSGGLSILLLDINEKYERVKGLRLIPLGTTAPASKIVDLGKDSLYYIASATADSQIIQLSKTKPHVKVVQTLTNFSPLLDLAIPEMAFAGREQKLESYLPSQSRVVAASGWEHTGTIRSIRSGIGLEVDGEVDLFGARQAWGVKKSKTDDFHDALIVGFVDETRAFGFDMDGSLEELAEYPGLKLNVESLLIGEYDRYRVQVTRKGVSFYSLVEGRDVGEWLVSTYKGGEEILFAAANDAFVILALNGNKAVTLALGANGFELQAEASWEDSPACVTIAPGDAAIAAMGFWGAGKVELLDCRSLSTLSTDTLSESEGSIPRSILLAPMLQTHPMSLLVGMSDGDLYSFVITEEATLAQRNKTVVGLQSMGLYAIPRAPADGPTDKTRKVGAFVASENPALLYANEAGNRLVYSAIQHDEVTFAAYFNSESFQDSVIVGTSEEVRFIHLDKERTMHVESKSTRDEGVPRRIVYSQEHNICAVALTAIKVDSEGRELFASKLVIYDSTFLEKLDEVELHDNELVECIETIVLPTTEGKDAECFVLGTALIDENAARATMGRIVVFEVTEGRKLGRRGAADKLGSCKTICKFDRMKHCFVVGLNKSVSIIHYEPLEKLSETHYKFTKLASYRCHSEPVEVSAIGDYIAVGDCFRGPSLVQFIRNTGDATSNTVDTSEPTKAATPAAESSSSSAKKDTPLKPKPAYQLLEVARTFDHFWTTSCQLLDQDTILAADAVGRVVVFQRNKEAVGDFEGLKLVKSCYYISNDVVNRIKLLPNPSKSSEEPQQSSSSKTFYHPVLPRAHLVTRSGAIVLFSLIPSELQNLLMQLQKGLEPASSKSKAAKSDEGAFKIIGPANINPFTAKRTSQLGAVGDINAYTFSASGGSLTTGEEGANYVRVVDGDLVITQAWEVMSTEEKKKWIEGVLSEMEKVKKAEAEKMEVDEGDEGKLTVEEVGWILERLERLQS